MDLLLQTNRNTTKTDYKLFKIQKSVLDSDLTPKMSLTAE